MDTAAETAEMERQQRLAGLSRQIISDEARAYEETIKEARDHATQVIMGEIGQASARFNIAALDYIGATNAWEAAETLTRAMRATVAELDDRAAVIKAQLVLDGAGSGSNDTQRKANFELAIQSNAELAKLSEERAALVRNLNDNEISAEWNLRTMRALLQEMAFCTALIQHATAALGGKGDGS